MTKSDDRAVETAPVEKRMDYQAGGGNAAAAPGFFTIYKSGQGYWTRLLTFFGFMLVGALTAHFIYRQTYGWIGQGAALGIAAGLFIAWVLVEYILINKPRNAEFLIATDSEMKKVNWTSRQELIGSTKVVIFFMFLITAVLFLYDLVFHAIFWVMTVLKEPPPFIPR